MKWQVIKKDSKSIRFYCCGFFGEYIFPVQIGLEKSLAQWVITGYGFEWIGTGNTPHPRTLIKEFESWTKSDWSKAREHYIKTGKYPQPKEKNGKNL